MRAWLWTVRVLIVLALIVDVRLYRYGVAGDILIDTGEGLAFPTVSAEELLVWIAGLISVHIALFWFEWRLRVRLRRSGTEL